MHGCIMNRQLNLIMDTTKWLRWLNWTFFDPELMQRHWQRPLWENDCAMIMWHVQEPSCRWTWIINITWMMHSGILQQCVIWMKKNFWTIILYPAKHTTDNCISYAAIKRCLTQLDCHFVSTNGFLHADELFARNHNMLLLGSIILFEWVANRKQKGTVESRKKKWK